MSYTISNVTFTNSIISNSYLNVVNFMDHSFMISCSLQISIRLKNLLVYSDFFMITDDVMGILKLIHCVQLNLRRVILSLFEI